MGGDLNKWKGSEIATSPSVQFVRKGGWFVSKGFVALIMAGFVVVLLAAVYLTMRVTEAHLKQKENSTIVSEPTDFPIVPLSYELLLNHSSASFSGEMKLSFKSVNNTKELNLKFIGTSVSSPILSCSDGRDSSLNITTSMNFNKDNGIVTISTDFLPEDRTCMLELTFEGNIYPEEQGVYKIPYKVYGDDGNLEDRWIIGANLAPAFCSRVFPCIEDSFERVNFRLKLIMQDNFSSVSNSFSKEPQNLPDNWKVDIYDWTPSLPVSSLMYFILPEYKEKHVPATIPLNIWYPLHLENTTEPLANISSSLVDFYKEYFQIESGLKTISLVIIDGLVSDLPGMFGIVPISSKVLYSKEHESSKREENLFFYLGKQLCNLWFGNVVNFKTWSDYWIQKGFCMYLADVAASSKYHAYRPSRFMLLQEEALNEGSFMHPMPVGFLSDNKEKTILPNKGAFIFHMVADILGPNNFQKGVRKFFLKWAPNTTELDNLWESFNKVQNEIDIFKFIDSWKADQYPIVLINKENEDIILKQVTSGSHLWSIPVKYITQMSPIPIYAGIMNTSSYQIKTSSNQSIIVNPDRSGFFISNYSPAMWSEITKDLVKNPNQFPHLVKAVLIDDAFSLAKHNKISYEIPLNLSLYLEKESLPAPWVSAMKHVNFISFFLENSEYEDYFKDYLRELIKRSQAALSSRKGAAKQTYLEIELIHWFCKYDLSENCSFLNTFKKWYETGEMSNDLPTYDAWKYVFCYGGRDDYDDSYMTSTDESISNASRKYISEPYEEFNILRSLTCIRNRDVLSSILNKTLDTSDLYFSAKRTIEVWLSLKETTVNSRIAFSYVKENWPFIYNRFKNGYEILKAILEGSTYALIEEQNLQEVRKLREHTEGEYIQRVFNSIEEKIKHNLQWKELCLKEVQKWLKSYAFSKQDSTNIF